MMKMPSKLFTIQILFIFLLSLDPVYHAIAVVDQDAAYLLINQRVNANRANFFVYQDSDSAFNHGFPSGLFGEINKIHFDVACVDDRNSESGCSTDMTRLDRERGNVLRISFDPLSVDQFAGVNIEEPENWGAQMRGVGYDLRGAVAVVFDLRSPTPGGIKVQFGVGGSVTEFIQIPQSPNFSTMTIQLNSLRPALSNLADVHILFTIVTNGSNAPNGGALLLDNIRFTPVPASQQTALGFPVATQAFGVVPAQTIIPGRVPIPLDQVIRNLSTIYESSLTLQALLERGTDQDRASARLIADTFLYALAHDNHGLPLPASLDGSVGLHSGFEGGDIALLNDQGPGAGTAGDVRLAGFSASKQLCGPSGFCLVLDGATGGNAAFAMLALLAAHKKLGDEKYLDGARIIGQWIVGNLTDNTNTGFGGYYLGYPDEGKPKEIVKGKSIENNADIFAAFTLLASIERERGNNAQADEWTNRANVAGDFVMRLFERNSGRFFGGTVPLGTPPSDGIKPDGPQMGNDVINTFDFLDSNTFTVLALAESPRYRNEIDWRRPVQWFLNQAVTVTAGGKTFTGFSIVANPTAGPEGIAWEFTGQAVVVMRFVDCLYKETTFKATADLYLDQIRQAQSMAPFADGQGIVASTLQDGDRLPPLEQCLSMPFQCIPERVGLAATTWAIFTERSLNPLSPSGILKICAPRISDVKKEGKKKLIVTGDNFDNGAVILLNGEKQKTVNDDQSPMTKLIGKKAGKKIKPGDKLQVRNLDGTLSPEFTFPGT
jgi:hypothetical protein